MSDTTTGATNAPETDTLTQPVGAVLSSASDSPAPATPAAPTDTAPAAGEDAAEDLMALAMQQMPPLDQIEVPGGESEPRRGGRGRRGSQSDDDGLRPGTVVSGTVVHIDNDGVLVDVGMKSEGLIRPNELSREPIQSADEVVKVGDKVDVFVMEPERDGTLLLSKKRADFEKSWDTMTEAMNDGRVVTGFVSERVKGGLVVDLGIRGFVPASHVGNGKMKNLDKYVNTEIPLKVLEVDRHNRKVVLSHRLATEEEREKEKLTTIGSLSEGQVRTGTIRRVTDYGAFVDLGGIDGLLHVSEMSWTRVKHPSDVVKVGQEVEVMILRLHLDQGRVSLGMRQVLPDPWSQVAEKFHVGDTVDGEITRVVQFGAFVLLESGIEGIIPASELSHRRVTKPSDVVEQGQQVQIKVIDVRPDERRLTLSLRALQPRDAEAEAKPAGGGTAPRTDEAQTGGAARPNRSGGRGRRRDDEEGGDFSRYSSERGDSSGSGFTIGDMFPELLSASGRGGGKAKGGRGRRRNEEEEDDLSDIDLDTDVSETEAAPEAEGEAEETL